jgi:hypothetical protein
VDHHDDWSEWAQPDWAHHEPGPGDPDTAQTVELGDHDPFGADHLADLDAHTDLDPHADLDAHADLDPSLDPHGALGPHLGPHLGPDEDFDRAAGAGPDLRHDTEFDDLPGPDHPELSTVDDPGLGHLVGADPDLTAGPADPDFPPPLELAHPPQPMDGYPWSDPDVLVAAGGGDAGTGPVGWADPPVGDLLSYAGLEAPRAGVDPWALLLGSDDPATSALARWWGPVS